MTILDLTFTFLVFALMGWFLEFAWRSVFQRKLVNPGLLQGPYLVLYGVAALMLTVLIRHLEGTPLYWKALAFLFSTTSLELVSGLIAEKIFHKKLWDYSDLKFHFRGLVSLRYSIFWVLISFFFELVVYPAYITLQGHLTDEIRTIFTLSLGILMFFDLIYTHLYKRILAPALSSEDLERYRGEFQRLAAPILAHPRVAELAGYPHHKKKSRLDHVVEVAFESFVRGRVLSLDTGSIVRGALLHDLFFYDWLREGPRLHGFRHPSIALRNAREYFELSPVEADIIARHMWPLTPTPPRFRESLLVSVIDTCCALKDYLGVSAGAYSGVLLAAAEVGGEEGLK